MSSKDIPEQRFAFCYSESFIENTMAEKDVIISEQEELLEERDSIITKQEGHIAGLETEMEENDKYLSELVDGKGQVCSTLKKIVLFYTVLRLRLFSTHRKSELAARTFIQSPYLKALAASLRVGFYDERKRGFIG